MARRMTRKKPETAVLSSPWVVVVGNRLNGHYLKKAKARLKELGVEAHNSFPEPGAGVSPVVVFTSDSPNGGRGHHIARLCVESGYQVRFIGKNGEIKF